MEELLVWKVEYNDGVLKNHEIQKIKLNTLGIHRLLFFYVMNQQ